MLRTLNGFQGKEKSWKISRWRLKQGVEMAKKVKRTRPWTKEEVRKLKVLAREKTRTTVIARKLKRSVAAVYLRASKLAVALGGGRKKRS
jgi:hypothetical protein